MHPAQILAAGQLSIALSRLRHEGIAFNQRNDRIDRWIEPLDVVQVGRHHLAAGNPFSLDSGRQVAAAHHHDLGDWRWGGECRDTKSKRSSQGAGSG